MAMNADEEIAALRAAVEHACGVLDRVAQTIEELGDEWALSEGDVPFPTALAEMARGQIKVVRALAGST